MRLRRLLRDERGTLYEIPLLILFVFLGLALVPAWHSWWKAFLVSALSIAGVLGGLVGLGLLWERVSERPAVAAAARVFDSAPARFLRAAADYALGAVGGGVMGAFAGLLASPHLSSEPRGQLLAMRVFLAAGAALGLAAIRSFRGQGPRF